MAKKSKKAPAPRGSSRSSQYRTQFTWAEEAVEGSSTIAAAWLQKPTEASDDAILLGLFYFRKPIPGRHKAQVWQVYREKGKIRASFMGSAPGHTEAYRRFYQPLRLKVREAQKEARKAAVAAGAIKATQAANMAARIVVGKPGKNDKRDLAVVRQQAGVTA